MGIKMDLREVGWSNIDWIHLTQDRDQWQVLVNTVINLRLHEIFGNSSASERLLACQEGLRSMELFIILYGIHSNIGHSKIYNLIYFGMIDVYENYLNILFSLSIGVPVILKYHPFATFRWHTAYVSQLKFCKFLSNEHRISCVCNQS
jgi:hypothetical protein